MEKKRVAFIGSGNMAEALIRGIISSGVIPASSMMACDIDPARLDRLSGAYGVRKSAKNEEGARWCDILVMSVKPRDIGEALESVRAAVTPSKLVISIAAGVRLARLGSALAEGVPVIRAMPNGPALVGRGITAVARGPAVTASAMEAAVALLGAVGEVMEVDEGLMDAVTAVGGSGPAYFFYLIEALAAAASAAGFSGQDARRLAIRTATGSMRWLEEAGSLPSELRAKVTSPGGTTEAAIKALEEGGFRGLVAAAVDAAIKRSRELGVN